MSVFKEQFQKLLLEKPRYNLKHLNAENCDYAETALNSKNCYYCFGAFYSEDLYYSRYSRKCTMSSDLLFCVGCDWCVECVNCVNCNMVSYSRYCWNCVETEFCFDCYSSQNCFGCVGLHRKQYCIFNEQFSKEEYDIKRKEIDISTQEARNKIFEKVEVLRHTNPNLAIHQYMAENSVGENIFESKNCYQCYDIFAQEDCAYCIETNGNKSCLDLTICFKNENCSSMIHSPMNYNCHFCYHLDTSFDSQFCAYSKNLKNCFGCVYMANKEYCILNEQYTPEEYFKKVQQIKDELLADKNYNLSLFFVSPYEAQRYENEEDSFIQSEIPTS